MFPTLAVLLAKCSLISVVILTNNVVIVRSDFSFNVIACFVLFLFLFFFVSQRVDKYQTGQTEGRQQQLSTIHLVRQRVDDCLPSNQSGIRYQFSSIYLVRKRVDRELVRQRVDNVHHQIAQAEGIKLPPIKLNRQKGRQLFTIQLVRQRIDNYPPSNRSSRIHEIVYHSLLVGWRVEKYLLSN